MPELILSCGHKEYVCTTISVEMYRRYTEIMERNDSDSISDAFEANTKILMTVFGARQREVEEADPEDVLSAVKEIHFMMQDVITKKFLDLNPEHLDLCQYFEHKKLKGYADFFNSSSSFCCGVI